MCTGLELMALGALGIGGGTYFQNEAMERKQDAADDVSLAGLKRQDAFDKERGDIYQDSLGAVAEEINQEALGTKAEELTEDLRGNVNLNEADYSRVGGASAPKVLQGRTGKRREEGDAYLDLLSNAQGRLGAWGNQMFDVGTDLSRLGWQNDRILTDAAADADLAAKMAQYKYNSTGNKTATAGNAMTQLGGMMLTQGAFNAGAAALGPQNTLQYAPELYNTGVPMGAELGPYGALRVVT